MSDAPMFPKIESTEELKAAAYAKGWNDCKAAILAHIASNTVPMVEQVPTLSKTDREHYDEVARKQVSFVEEAPYVQQSGRAKRVVSGEPTLPRYEAAYFSPYWYVWDRINDKSKSMTRYATPEEVKQACDRLNNEKDQPVIVVQDNATKLFHLIRGESFVIKSGYKQKVNANEAARLINAGKCFYAPDGTMMNADGTRSIFDDVDK